MCNAILLHKICKLIGTIMSESKPWVEEINLSISTVTAEIVVVTG